MLKGIVAIFVYLQQQGVLSVIFCFLFALIVTHLRTSFHDLLASSEVKKYGYRHKVEIQRAGTQTFAIQRGSIGTDVRASKYKWGLECRSSMCAVGIKSKLRTIADKRGNSLFPIKRWKGGNEV